MSNEFDPEKARPPSRGWLLKQESLVRDLHRTAERSPILRVLDPPAPGVELRTVVGFAIPTLVAEGPGREKSVRLSGPVVIGIRYAESFIDAPPEPWEIATIIAPRNAFHPNVHPGGGLCLGSPPVGIGMEEILHLCFAAIVLASYRTPEWEGLNPPASQFVRDHAGDFPIVETGLFEHPDPRFHCPFPEDALSQLADVAHLEELQKEPRSEPDGPETEAGEDAVA